MSEWPIESPDQRAAAVVRRYLEALAARDWTALAETLDPDIERIGPYNDVVGGRDAYAGFLAETLQALEGYELRVARVIATDDVVAAELSETVDTPQGRRRTDEAIVFDVSSAGRIVRVSVYLRRSVTEPA